MNSKIEIPKELLDSLNQAISGKVRVAIQYMRQHVLWCGIKGYVVKDAFNEVVKAEIKHAEIIAERLAYLSMGHQQHNYLR